MVKNPQTDVQKITVATGQRPRRHKNNNMTFEQVPSAMEKMQAMLATIQSKIDALALQQD